MCVSTKEDNKGVWAYSLCSRNRETVLVNNAAHEVAVTTMNVESEIVII